LFCTKGSDPLFMAVWVSEKMQDLELVKLVPLMNITSGKPEITIGLIDGPVAMDHPDLASENIHAIPGTLAGMCSIDNSVACMHGTFVAGVLCAKRGSPAPAICPGCTMLVRPIFSETSPHNGGFPIAAADELAAAIVDCVEQGAQIINLSAALAQPSPSGDRELADALNLAARRGVIVVAAAGNQAVVGSTAITRHPWVIPVAAVNLAGKSLDYSNLGNSISRNGLSAPGENIASLSTKGRSLPFNGTSAATPFVTGAVALLSSLFPQANATQVKLAVQRASGPRRSVVPPLLNAWGAHHDLQMNSKRRPY
jgi:subtilisin family serine protease